jgi:hypothetical protein
VVVAYAFGGQVRRGGVRSAAWAHVWHPNFVTANVCVLMAGYLAEEKFQGHHWRWEEDVIKELRAVRSGHNEDVSLRGNPTDVRAIARTPRSATRWLASKASYSAISATSRDRSPPSAMRSRPRPTRSVVVVLRSALPTGCACPTGLRSIGAA